MVATALLRIARIRQDSRLLQFARWMSALWISSILLGVLNVVLKNVLSDADPAENRIEWMVFILMQSYFFFLYAAWVHSGFRATVTTHSG